MRLEYYFILQKVCNTPPRHRNESCKSEIYLNWKLLQSTICIETEYFRSHTFKYNIKD